jgi:spermidine synthase
MPRPVWKVTLLLFGSGACSLIYETVWLRELRLVFGASTMASAAVVACFVGGLGAGGLLFGKRADAHPRPLAMYAALEAGIAASAASTPLVLWIVRAAYIGAGGTRVLGSVAGSAVRLLLAATVFALPTLLMGGTLPAVARAVESEDDRGRRVVSLLYGANTLGAVAGCMLSTFVLFETFGTRLTLWIACLVNALVAIVARSLARSMPAPRIRPAAEPVTRERAAPVWFTLAAAAVSGFVFCLMELVWYRMLGPLLGGTVFTFGLVLAIALLGIGLGGLAYGARPRERETTTSGFAWASLAGALCVAIPYALGDRLAVLAAVLRPVRGLSFALEVAEWAVVTSIVVLPAAFVSGVQFPLLIGLLGRGDQDVGRDVGRTYAANTAGAIVGSIAGGFGLIPALTAPGCWRLVVWLLFLLGAGAVAITLAQRRSPLKAVAPLVVGFLALSCLRATGPTAAWRHSPIGSGRVDPSSLRSPNAVRAWEHSRRRAIRWEADGRESSVAIDDDSGLAFVVNGKNDGNAITDAGTAVMAGLVGAILHPNPTRAMVIGLGTGESAGWLAAIDSMTNVDVAELEPAILEVARQSAVGNHGALDNPKVHVEIGDARELLLTSKRRYDIVASEPSNPYRAGIASLFTRDYYEAIASRLESDGLFLQWLQGYEVNASTVRTVYSTLASVFGVVETWEVSSGDLLLVCAKKAIAHDVASLRARMAVEPYRTAIGRTWRATEIEGFLSHFVATGSLAQSVARQEANAVNTDDLNIVEFGFARSVGTGQTSFSVDQVRRVARARGEHRPDVSGAVVDWDQVDDGVIDLYLGDGARPMYGEKHSGERGHRIAALRAFDEGNSPRAVVEWRAQHQEPRGPTETALIAMAFADVGDEGALGYADALRALGTNEADAIVARLRLRQGRLDEAVAAFESFFEQLHSDPWPLGRLVASALDEAKELAARDARFAPRLYAVLRAPFALHLLDDARKQAALAAAVRIPGNECVQAVDTYEPNVPWEEDFLRIRAECYRVAHEPRAEPAARDLIDWRGNRPELFGAGLQPPP